MIATVNSSWSWSTVERAFDAAGARCHVVAECEFTAIAINMVAAGLGLEPFVRRATAQAGLSVRVHAPLMTNSDHANFAAHGIPALRLLAGFDEPESNLRYLLTGADTALLTNSKEQGQHTDGWSVALGSPERDLRLQTCYAGRFTDEISWDWPGVAGSGTR